jgi:HEAT repeat protein/type 1 glutamine amidotransferase
VDHLRLKLIAIWFCLLSLATAVEIPHQVLIVTGHNNHKWEVSSVVYKQILEQTELFNVDMAVRPPLDKETEIFNPNFSQYDVVFLDYNGAPWPKETQDAFVNYVHSGGGVVLAHAANNSFGDWPEYLDIIGLGGWGGRDESDGPYIYWQDGKFVREVTPGKAGGHGPQHEFQVINRDMNHPITKGLPEKWMRGRDELYSHLRGQGKNMHILATAYSNPADRNGSGRHEPVMMTIDYGKGRVFHTPLGHVTGTVPYRSLECGGFITIIQRGTEWAATGNVTQEVPIDFPDAVTVRSWKQYVEPEFESVLNSVKYYKYGDNRLNLTVIEDMIRVAHRNPNYLSRIEQSLVTFLMSDASIPAKQVIGKYYSLIAKPVSAEAIATLLDDPNLYETALYILERIPGESVNGLLQKNLSVANDKVKASIINTLGTRQDKNAVPKLKEYIQSNNPDIATATAFALGNIGTWKAAKLLKKSLKTVTGNQRKTVLDAYLECGNQLLNSGDLKKAKIIFTQLSHKRENPVIRSAAIRGLIQSSPGNAGKIILNALKESEPKIISTAISSISLLSNSDDISTVAKSVNQLPVNGQIQLTSALSTLGENSTVFSTIKLATESENGPVRLAALDALGNVNLESSVSLLANISAHGFRKERTTARASLYKLNGNNINDIILSKISHAETKVKIELIRAVQKRRIKKGADLMLTLANDANPSLRIESARALRFIANEPHITGLVNLLKNSESDKDQDELEKAIVIMAKSNGLNNAMGMEIMNRLDAMPFLPKQTAIKILGQLGYEPSYESLIGFLNHHEKDIRKSAIKALSEWKNDSPLSTLFSVTEKAKSQSHKTLALRGIIRLIGLESDRSTEATNELYKRAMALAANAQEKKAVLSGLSNVMSISAFRMAETYLPLENLKAEAAASCIKIANGIHTEYPVECKPVLVKIISDIPNESIKENAQLVLNQIEIYDDYITKWRMSEPFMATDKSIFNTAFGPELATYGNWTTAPLMSDPNRYWYVDFAKIIKSMVAAIYMETEFWSDVQQTVRLEMGSNDGIKTWLNGQVVHVHDASRGVTAGEDVKEVTLQKGKNILLMKIVNEGGGWGGCARLRRLDGGHLSNVKIDLQSN